METLREQLNRIDREYSPDLYNLYEIAKQMDALLEECAGYHQCSELREKLKKAGYGNGADR